MEEPKVKALVRDWLVERGYEPTAEFEVEGGRLDYLGARWVDDGARLDIVGVECKGEPSPSEVLALTSAQLHRYAQCVPSLYLACTVPSAYAATFREFCRMAGVGLLAFLGDTPEVTLPPAEIGARFDDGAYLRQVRSKVALRIAFRAVFGAEVRQGPNWISTPEPGNQVQWNAWIDEATGDVVLGVNMENAQRVLAAANVDALATALHALPVMASLRATMERYYAPSRRSLVTVLQAPASAITVAELHYLRNLAETQSPVHVTVTFPLWRLFDVRTRSWHETTVSAAAESLSPVRKALGA